MRTGMHFVNPTHLPGKDGVTIAVQSIMLAFRLRLASVGFALPLLIPVRRLCVVAALAVGGCSGRTDHEVASDAGAHEVQPPAASDATVRDAGADEVGPRLPTLSVLFVGNSFTQVNDLPANVQQLAATTSIGPMIDVESETVGGATFVSHWTGYGGADAQTPIAKANHTHVVLQGQSGEPLIYPETFAEYGALLVNAAKAAGAKPVLYETWAYKGSEFYAQASWSGGSPAAMQNALSAAYEKLGAETGATVAPVGEAWRVAWTEHPEIELYQADGRHPSAAGTYLAACVFYIVLTERPLAASSAVPAGVAAADATVLRSIATRVATK
jgi:hypothetical protein